MQSTKSKIAAENMYCSTYKPMNLRNITSWQSH